MKVKGQLFLLLAVPAWLVGAAPRGHVSKVRDAPAIGACKFAVVCCAQTAQLAADGHYFPLRVVAAAEAYSSAQASGGGQATAVSQALASAGASNAQQVRWFGRGPADKSIQPVWQRPARRADHGDAEQRRLASCWCMLLANCVSSVTNPLFPCAWCCRAVPEPQRARAFIPAPLRVFLCG